ncbi:MAG: hypothetical protein LBJ08_04410 [Bifidobacteriaceae bacterium]|jgi:hypothetical protein|nr:hypothetical protein [Bifidobacteriaceae bacterium]
MDQDPTRCDRPAWAGTRVTTANAVPRVAVIGQGKATDETPRKAVTVN